VREHGRSVQARLMRVGCFKLAEGCPSRVGIITSRRVGGAVVRNRVRRRLREIVRHALGDMPAGWDVVIVAKSTAAGATLEELQAEWLLLCRRLSIFPPSL
jgi:ribonuclease P protein component